MANSKGEGLIQKAITLLIFHNYIILPGKFKRTHKLPISGHHKLYSCVKKRPILITFQQRTVELRYNKDPVVTNNLKVSQNYSKICGNELRYSE